MKKNVNYYRSLLHKDSITLLIIAIIFTIGSIFFQDAPTLLKSIMFIVLSIIVMVNKKEIKNL